MLSCPLQEEFEVRRARLLELGKDERLSERVWRTVKGPSDDDKMSLNDLMRLWKGAFHNDLPTFRASVHPTLLRSAICTIC